MRASIHRGGRRRGSTLVLFTFMLPTVLIPLVGLAIDASRLYIVQAQLASAVDGAALGSGRLLETDANTTEIAGEFLKANFPTGFWGSTNLQPNIQFTKTFIMNQITVSATVDVPLLFMRYLGASQSAVAASAVATRKETRVELVIDRSGTMTELSSVQQTATQFTESFIPGYDEMGLVVFSNSGVVGYPTTRPYNSSPTSAGGPDSNFYTEPAGGNGCCDMVDMINDISRGGFTNMSEGLALAYLELQKANNRDQDPTRLNAIVLFTDGFPNAFSMYANDPNSNSLKSTSKCKNNPATAGTASTQIIGWAGGGPGGGSPYGLYFLGSSDSNTTAYWMQYAKVNSTWPDQQVVIPSNLNSAIQGCADLDNTNSDGVVTPNLGDLQQVPTQSYWGDSTSDSPYTTAYKSSGSYSGKSYSSSTPTDATNIGIAAWNATDAVGRRILSDTNLNITIYVIGYTGSEGNPDTYLLKRLANTTDSSNYTSTWQAGQYVAASNPDELAAAFQAVASFILRLAH
jgi:Flp pilus assembly protein TadG